jgi:hypothetical protein
MRGGLEQIRLSGLRRAVFATIDRNHVLVL